MLRFLRRSVIPALAALLVAASAFAEPAMRVQASARQSDGRILYAGTAPGPIVQVGRLNADGSVDTSFGLGLAQYFEFAYDARVTAVAPMENGGVLVAYVRFGDIAFLRFDPSGNLDPAFGAGGYLRDADGFGFRVNALVAQPGGAFIAAGAYENPVGSPPNPALVRYLANGARDLDFGPLGMQVYAMGGGELRAAMQGPGGTIVAAGYSRATPAGDKAFLVARFLSNGAPDGSFGGGLVISNVLYGDDDEAFAVTIASNGDVVAAGRQRAVASPICVVRLGSSGQYVGFFDTTMHASENPFAPIDATAMSVAEIPGSSDLIVGVKAAFYDTGRAQFGAVRAIAGTPGSQQPSMMGPAYADGDDFLAAAYPNADGKFVAIGTRQSPTGDFLRRARYYSDPLAFETDDPTAAGPDSTPEPLQFTAQGGLAAGEVRVSNTATIVGINVPVPISIDAGAYSIGCNGIFTSAPGTIENAQTVCVMAQAATSPFTTTQVVLHVGGVDNVFALTTGGVPETSITWTPPSPSGPAGQFNFETDPNLYGANATFECALDGGVPSACTSYGYSGYYNFASLAPGSHTFTVRAGNSWGTDATPASFTWNVVPAPHTTITSSPPALSSSTSATFTFASDQPDSTFNCKLDNAWYTTCAPTTTFSVTAGPHQLWVYATAGPAAEDPPVTYSWTVDLTPPTTTITSGPPATTDNPNASFAFSASEAATFRCATDSGGFAACTSPVSLVVHSGSHTFSVYAIDAAGNPGNIATRSWTANFGAPFLFITDGPSGTVSSTSATFTFTFGPVSSASAECALDAGAYVPCASPVTYTGLAQSGHLFTARARDATGDTSIVQSRNWTVDTIAPNTTLWGKPPAVTNSASAQFNWSANESGVTFQSRLDGQAWENVGGSTLTYTGLAEGAHSFDIRAVDAAGNIDPTPDGWTWTVDFTGPHSVINSGPAAVTANTGATFTFSSEAGATFLCSIDAAPMVACTSPATFTGLADGLRKFNLLARDAAGNLETSGQLWQWTIDTSVPDTTVTGGPSGTTTGTGATFTFSASETGVSFECSLDGAAWTACSSGVTFSGLAEGMHMFEVRALDAAGNVDPTPAQRSWSIDTTSPNTTITSGPAVVTNDTTATLAFTATEAAAFQCTLDGAAYSACTSPASFAALSNGSHSFSVYSVDAAGNADASPATWSWVIDTVAPETSLTGAPSGAVASTSATLAFTSPDSSATFECRLDGAAYATCASPVALSALAQGAHSFEVRAKDAAGNADASPAVASWIVDTVEPDTSITSAPPAAANTTTASFAFSASEAATFECKLDAGAWASCTSPKSYTGLSQASHTFQVRARDVTGNYDPTPASVAWTVDTTAPNTTITGGPTGNNNPNTATFTFTSSEAGTFECKLDTGAYAACASPTTFSGLAKGSHTFSVRSVDAAGNVDNSPATRNWSVK